LESIRLGVSACLLGESVRYDGSHRFDRYLVETLGRFVEWVPVCPEVEAGLGVPREAMRLVGEREAPRLVTGRTGIDQTSRMKRWARKRIRQLGEEELCGFIFKSRSPSSGMERVRIYTAGGEPGPYGSGIFARAFMDACPLIPVEDEERMREPALRENFIERVFTFNRWRALTSRRASAAGLAGFHSDHKYLLMAHSPSHLKRLGQLVANPQKVKPSVMYASYLPLMMEGLRLKATVPKNANVLEHLLGYFKKQLSPEEKQEALGLIGRYRQGLVPLVSPVTLVRHLVRRYDEPYLSRQVYLNPHPAELMLKNHV